MGNLHDGNEGTYAKGLLSKPPMVLIIDESYHFRSYLRHIIKESCRLEFQKGHDVEIVEAKSGMEAIEVMMSIPQSRRFSFIMVTEEMRPLRGTEFCHDIQELVFNCPPIFMFSDRKLRKRPPRVMKIFTKAAFRHRDARTLLRDYCEPHRTPQKRGLYSGGVPLRQQNARISSKGRLGDGTIDYKPSPPRPQSSFSKSRWRKNGISRLHPRVLQKVLEQRHSESPRVLPASPRERRRRDIVDGSASLDVTSNFTNVGILSGTKGLAQRPSTTPGRARGQDYSGGGNITPMATSPRERPRVPPLQISTLPLFRSPSQTPRSVSLGSARMQTYSKVSPVAASAYLNSSTATSPSPRSPAFAGGGSPRPSTVGGGGGGGGSSRRKVFVPMFGSLRHHQRTPVSGESPRFLH